MTDNAAKEQIRHGIRQSDKQAPFYNNINFTIFRDMLPFMEGARDQGPAATRFFVSYVQRRVFDPAGVTDAACAPVRDAMLIYPPPGAATGPGKPVPSGPSGCSGGGWFMTPAGMLRVLYGLIGGHSLLSRSQRRQMDGNCLGWDCSLTGTASYVGKTGDFGGLHVFFGIVAGTIPVVVVTNSNWGATNPNLGENLTPVVETALFAATSYR